MTAKKKLIKYAHRKYLFVLIIITLLIITLGHGRPQLYRDRRVCHTQKGMTDPFSIPD